MRGDRKERDFSMIRRHLICFLVVVAIALGAASTAWAQEAEVKWRYDYNTARKEALEKSLPLVLDFGTKQCFWCRKLDETTFREPRLVSLMNECFIPLKIDAEKEIGLTQALDINSFPTLILGAPDGKILDKVEGYKDASQFQEILHRALATVRNLDWMVRDYQQAQKWLLASELDRAIPLLKTIVEDGKGRPIQASARKALAELEQQVQGRLGQARQLQDQGQVAEAADLLTETVRLFPGLQATGEANEVLAKLAHKAELRSQQRVRRAKDLLTQAQEFFKGKEFMCCLDRCEVLISAYGDLPEGQEASLLAAEIKSNPAWMQSACDSLSERLGGLYLALADALVKKGQPQQAQKILQRVIQTFPGSRQAETAQVRLGQVQGTTVRRLEVPQP